jgi:L-cystine transport system ATP-binding protein
MTKMIEIANLYKRFGANEVLKGINFTVESGEKVVIIGPSGSGKTTLLRCMNLLETPTEGSIRIGSQELSFSPDTKPSKSKVIMFRKQTGMVFQGYHLFPHMTALQNVMEGQVTVLRRSKEEARERAMQLLDRVGLIDKAPLYPYQLSGGQQQRIAIARAMAMDPGVLLFDEPTSALDPELVGEVLKVIKELALAGMTMVIVTHEMSFAHSVADKVVFIDEGVIAETGSPREIFEDTENPRLRQFLNRITHENV